MKQLLFTAVGIWIVIAAVTALTYLPGDASPHDRPADPIIRNLNLSLPPERGAGIRLELTGFPSHKDPAAEQGEKESVVIERWWVESLPRDYRRTRGPLHENVSVYLSVTNEGERPLERLALTIDFLNNSGYVVHSEKTETRLALPPGASAERMRFWYAENNEFVPNDPYDIVVALIASRAVQVRVTVREATFKADDG